MKWTRGTKNDDVIDARGQSSLMAGLAESHRAQFGQSFSRAWLTAYYAARAAFVFKDGESRDDYRKALEPLRTYYAATLPPGSADVNRVAELELEWWILHRERAGEPLVEALAALQAEIYRMPVERFRRHAELRAEAMRLCDAGGDWGEIARLLDGSWMALSDAVRPTT